MKKKILSLLAIATFSFIPALAYRDSVEMSDGNDAMADIPATKDCYIELKQRGIL